MRWVFLSLVLMNAIFFSWRYFVPRPAEALPSPQETPSAAPSLPKPIVDNSPSITLLEELDSSRAVPSPSALAFDEVKRSGDICYWAGPLADDADRDVLLRRLKGLNIVASERVTRAAGDLRYWVYLPPLSSKDEAKAQLAALQSKGIDSYLIHKGERKNGISLGLFSQLELAESREAEVRAAGWEATMDTYKRSVNQRWITASKEQLDAVGEGILPRMLKNKSDVTIIEKKCELPVASHNNIH